MMINESVVVAAAAAAGVAVGVVDGGGVNSNRPESLICCWTNKSRSSNSHLCVASAKFVTM